MEGVGGSRTMFNMLAYIKYPFAHRTCTYTQGRANSWGTICRNRPGVPITDVTIVSEFLKSSQEHKMNSIPFCLYGCHFKLVQIMKLTIPLPPTPWQHKLRKCSIKFFIKSLCCFLFPNISALKLGHSLKQALDHWMWVQARRGQKHPEYLWITIYEKDFCRKKKLCLADWLPTGGHQWVPAQSAWRLTSSDVSPPPPPPPFTDKYNHSSWMLSFSSQLPHKADPWTATQCWPLTASILKQDLNIQKV